VVLTEGLSVKYKDLIGVIAFVCDHSISILISKGKHPSHDVKIVVYNFEFNSIEVLGEK
jgi:hypothetical protein